MEQVDESNNSLQRVKVYLLNSDGMWDDYGTGHLTFQYMEGSEDHGLCVVDEVDGETLLWHRISSEDIYRKEGDTMIIWRDQEHSSEISLSFQEYTDCSYIWDQICRAQRSRQFNSLDIDEPVEESPVADVGSATNTVSQSSNSQTKKSLPRQEIIDIEGDDPLVSVHSHQSSSKLRKLDDKELSGMNYVYSGKPPLQDIAVVAMTSQDMDNINVKATYNGVAIRFELLNSSGMAELEDSVIERLKLERDAFSIKYKDEEGDWVLIACDKDVQKCIESTRSLGKTNIKMLVDLPISRLAP